MKASKFLVRPERADDSSAVSTLVQDVFGPGSKARAAYALRENRRHEMHLSFVAEHDGQMIGTVRQTRILWGGQSALMLGPLGVLPVCKNQGVGKALMQASVSAARTAASQGAEPIIMLVGDLAYYEPFGFRLIPFGQIQLPRPADPARILFCELEEGALSRFNGMAQRITGQDG